MTGVELTRRVPCATCGGTGITITAIPEAHIADGVHTECWICRGDGTVRVAVSCATCRHWNQGYYCSKTDTFNCGPNHGCKSWQAKEGTDGR